MQLKLADSKFSLASILWIAPFFLWGTAMVAMKSVMPDTTPFIRSGRATGTCRNFGAGDCGNPR